MLQRRFHLLLGGEASRRSFAGADSNQSNLPLHLSQASRIIYNIVKNLSITELEVFMSKAMRYLASNLSCQAESAAEAAC